MGNITKKEAKDTKEDLLEQENRIFRKKKENVKKNMEELEYAIKYYDIKGVYDALQKFDRKTINTERRHKENILFYVTSEWTSEKILHMLIKAGANVNHENVLGETPLFSAIKGNFTKTEIVKILLDNGADVKHVNTYKESALKVLLKIHYRDSTHRDIINLLVCKGAVIDDDMLLNCVKSSNFDQAKLFLVGGASAKAKNNLGESCIQAMCLLHMFPPSEKEMVDMFNTLVKAGADINNKNNKGVSTVKYAIRYEANLILELLIKEHDIILTEEDNKVLTPFQEALVSKNDGAIEMLLNSGKEIDPQRGINDLALSDAIHEKDINKIKEILKEKDIKEIDLLSLDRALAIDRSDGFSKMENFVNLL